MYYFHSGGRALLVNGNFETALFVRIVKTDLVKVQHLKHVMAANMVKSGRATINNMCVSMLYSLIAYKTCRLYVLERTKSIKVPGRLTTKLCRLKHNIPRSNS